MDRLVIPKRGRIEKTAGWLGLGLLLCLSVPLGAEEITENPSGSNDQLTAIQEELTHCQGQVKALEGQLVQQRGEGDIALAQARSQAEGELQQTRRETQDAIDRVRSEAATERERTLAQFERETQAAAAEQQAIQTHLTAQWNSEMRRAEAAEQRARELEARNQQLANQLVQVEGGTITLEAAQEQARAVYGRYRELVEHHSAHHQRDPNTGMEIVQTAGELVAAQHRVVRAMGAKGLQIIRRGDTLSSVARLTFGEAHQWKVLREANHYLLGDNAKLLEGTPLVIP